ncbi:hypothetical protein BJY00DRAFT_141873 [Aspergillus carlsbadensis]|nr:hypothetical protein BJY00DRAFT_141873 [Aspergillus carlsbadensis]
MGGVYLLTRYEDVKAAASYKEIFIFSMKAVIPGYPRGIRRPPLNTDPPAPILAATAAAWVNAWRRQDGKETTAQPEKLYGIARKLLADRRIAPRDPEQDPASSLLQETELSGQPLKDELFMYVPGYNIVITSTHQGSGCLRQSLVVGMVARPLLFAVMCKHLSDDKQLQHRLRSDPSLILGAVEEFVRLYVPYGGFCQTPS